MGTFHPKDSLGNQPTHSVVWYLFFIGDYPGAARALLHGLSVEIQFFKTRKKRRALRDIVRSLVEEATKTPQMPSNEFSIEKGIFPCDLYWKVDGDNHSTFFNGYGQQFGEVYPYGSSHFRWHCHLTDMRAVVKTERQAKEDLLASILLALKS